MIDRKPITCRRLVGCMIAVGLAGLLAGCITENSNSSSIGDDPPAASADHPPGPGTLHALARILASQGRDAECERVLMGIIQRNPTYAPAYSDLSELYLRRNRAQDAEQALNMGLKQAPNDPILLNNLGMCRLLQEDYAAALEQFTRASDAAPRNRTYLANKATALGMLDRLDEAGAIYMRILESQDDVRHNLAVLQAARTRWVARQAVPTTAPATLPSTRPAE